MLLDKLFGREIVAFFSQMSEIKSFGFPFLRLCVCHLEINLHKMTFSQPTAYHLKKIKFKKYIPISQLNNNLLLGLLNFLTKTTLSENFREQEPRWLPKKTTQ